MNKTPFLLGIVCTFSLLLGCEPSRSEQVRWDIQQGTLWFGSDEVNWQQAAKTGACDTCVIKQRTNFHPSGPSLTLQLFEDDMWRAAKIDEFHNWVTIWPENSPIKLFVTPLSERELSLSLPAGKVKINLQSRVDFSYEGKRYQLWVESYRPPSNSEHFSNELDSHHINYLLLSLE